MRTFMFPGQGSQARAMGGTLFDEFKELTQRADEILGYSIRELCLEDPRDELGKTQFTQPALYVVNALSYLKKNAGGGNPPDYLAGHSLGEFNALLAAGCFDFETGLQLVRKRGELMSEAGSGAMAAILRASKEQVEAVLRDNGLTDIDLANLNTPSQIVISGALDAMDQAQHLFKGGMIFHPLRTSGAFHSRFMRPAQEAFRSYLTGFTLSDPKIPVIANVTARPYETGQVLDNLAKQIASPVRWCESIQYLLELGDNANDPVAFEEVGHGDVLTKLVHAIKQQTSRESKTPVSKQGVRTEATVNAAHAAPQTASEKAVVPEKIKAEDKVLRWNRKYPIGTQVKSSMPGYPDLETRTAAIVLFGHRAAVYMKGYNGYFDLDEVTPLLAQDGSREERRW